MFNKIKKIIINNFMPSVTPVIKTKINGGEITIKLDININITGSGVEIKNNQEQIETKIKLDQIIPDLSGPSQIIEFGEEV